jgi:GT2 family glycosyltransferase
MISIIMAYHNRRQLLINTLRSISYNNQGKDDFEIIIVDDASDKEHLIGDLPGKFPELHIFVIRLAPKDKKHLNPCITYNIAFNFIRGDIVLYQNTECLHVGDILGIIRAYVKKGTHFTFAVYSVNWRLQEKLNKIEVFNETNIRRVLLPMVGFKENWTDGDICWYNHSNYRRAFGSFIWAMTRADLEEMNGFDERYAYGFAFDDAEFTVRLARKKMFIRYSDMPFAVHQFHIPSDYNKMSYETAVNRDIYHNFTMVEKGFKALHNKFYKKT